MKMALLMSSPAVRDGIVELGRFFNNSMISIADCFKNSLIFTSGNLICFDRNRTVFESISDPVSGI